VREAAREVALQGEVSMIGLASSLGTAVLPT
jgi:hypothetical protein